AAAAIAIGVIALPSSDAPARLEPGLAALAGDEPAATASLPGIPPVAAPAIALADGSVATLYDGASLELRAQTDDEIRIDQIGGRVHYEVVPELPRTFVVEAAGVQVQVVGTAFWVAHEPAHVRVTVEHGRVRVNRLGDATQAELGPGDELRLEQVDDEPVIDTGDDESTRPRTRTKKPTKSDPRATVDELLARADAAAAARDTVGAIAALREIVDDHPNDPHAYSSAFKLGKLERARGRHAAAAAAFGSAARRSPSGTLSADARAEAAIAWFDAGQHDKARAAGEDYLERHPSGEHVARIQRMLDRLP
ncbi:MAG TPA: tetratricopeptide repeat protein, partial [Nannocystaceae bacterium]|nr:tetratricopeptide repeat protein [Nannocystaceae bacterium]